MKWVTRAHVHLDRVATPWLICRFIDPGAEFLFVAGATDPRPDDAIPFGLPGVELSAHDEHGSTYRKVAARYGIDDPLVGDVGRIVEGGIAIALGTATAGTCPAESAGLNAISEGLHFSGLADDDVIRRSLPVYDGLYVSCAARRFEAERSAADFATPQRRFGALLAAALPQPPFRDWTFGEPN